LFLGKGQLLKKNTAKYYRKNKYGEKHYREKKREKNYVKKNTRKKTGN
jgi:hypothetical protein